jgi:hypothetical protein
MLITSGIFGANIGHYSKLTNEIPVSIRPTFRNNSVDLESEYLIEKCPLVAEINISQLQPVALSKRD